MVQPVTAESLTPVSAQASLCLKGWSATVFKPHLVLPQKRSITRS